MNFNKNTNAGAKISIYSKKMSHEKFHQYAWYAGFGFFIAFISAHLVYGVRTAVKVLGTACAITGLIWVLRRSIPIGVEGKKPIRHLKGPVAVIAGFLMLLMGVMLLIYSSIAACIFNWDASECS